MFIYIPTHLKSIGLIDLATKMLKEYVALNGSLGSTGSDSFDRFYYYFTLDPVKNFIRMCLSSSGDELDPGILSYLIKLFYSVKGTPKVLDLMETELDLRFIPDELGRKYVYDSLGLKYSIEEVGTFNIDSWISAQEKFLGALLFYQDLSVQIRRAFLNIKEELSSGISCTGWNIMTHEIENT